MPRPARFAWLLVAGAALLPAHQPALPEMTDAAKAFVDSLTGAQRERALYPLRHDEREAWSFVPRRRQGVPLQQLSASQRPLAFRLLHSALSVRGARQAADIIALEKVLRELEGSSHRDPELYYVTLFGEPGAPPWGWRFEGHHLSLNVTVPDDHHIVVTPNFFGANPATVPSGPSAGQRTLAAEEDLARALVRSLDDEQRKSAIIAGRAPRDIITGNDARVAPLSPSGLPVAQLTPAQQDQLGKLLEVYLGRYQDDISAATRERITGGSLDGLHFAWAGSLEPGEGHYYRIQGPTFVIEYDNTQNDANHIHTTFRDFERDFGRDLLREHYRESH